MVTWLLRPSHWSTAAAESADRHVGGVPRTCWRTEIRSVRKRERLSNYTLMINIRVNLAGFFWSSRRGGSRRLRWVRSGSTADLSGGARPLPQNEIFAWNSVFRWILSGIFEILAGHFAQRRHSIFWGMFPRPSTSWFRPTSPMVINMITAVTVYERLQFAVQWLGGLD